jgi:hypothetical protein
VDPHVGVVEGGLPEHSQGLLARYRAGEFPPEELVDDESRVVVAHVQIPEESGERGDVDRAVAVGEHLVDCRAVPVDGHAVDLGVELRFEGGPGVVQQGHDALALADAVALRGDDGGCDAHTGRRRRSTYSFGKAFITPVD